jgi:hypothetical protein
MELMDESSPFDIKNCGRQIIAPHQAKMLNEFALLEKKYNNLCEFIENVLDQFPKEYFDEYERIKNEK